MHNKSSPFHFFLFSFKEKLLKVFSYLGVKISVLSNFDSGYNLLPFRCLSGGDGESGARWRLSYRPLRRHPVVAHCWRPGPHSHPETPGGAAAGNQRGPPAMSRGLQHAGLSLNASQRHAWREAALGLPPVRSRARLPQLGQPPWGEGGPGGPPQGVSHVQNQRAVRCAVAGLRGGLLRGRGPAHSRL